MFHAMVLSHRLLQQNKRRLAEKKGGRIGGRESGEVVGGRESSCTGMDGAAGAYASGVVPSWLSRELNSKL